MVRVHDFHLTEIGKVIQGELLLKAASRDEDIVLYGAVHVS